MHPTSRGNIYMMQSNPRSIEYVENVLHSLGKVWMNGQHPHLRLGQLIEVAMSESSVDLFNISDLRLLELLDELCVKNKL